MDLGLQLQLLQNIGGGGVGQDGVQRSFRGRGFIQLFATPWTVACQASLSMVFSRQQYWSRLPSIFQGIFLTQGSNLGLLHCRQILYHLSHQGSPWPPAPEPSANRPGS